MDIDDTAKEQLGAGSLPYMDNPRHDQIKEDRQPFLPRRVGGYEGVVRDVVRSLIASWRDRGEVDLAQELAWPIPFDVFFKLMGLPAVRGGSRSAGHGFTASRASAWNAPSDAGRAGLHGCDHTVFHRHPERASQDPQRDLVTQIVPAEIDGVPFCEEDVQPASEVLGLMMVLYSSAAWIHGRSDRDFAEAPG